MSQPVDRMRWREAIMSELGPKNPLARIVLMAVSMPMHQCGTGAWESQETIARRAYVGLRTVKRHLEIAERHGWVVRNIVKVPGRKWRRTEYEAVVPDDVYEQLPEKPWIADPTWRRPGAPPPARPSRAPKKARWRPPDTEEEEAGHGATVAPSGSNALRNEVPTTTGHGANGARHGANGDIDDRPSCGLLIRNLNPQRNPQEEGALARTPTVAIAKGKTKTPEEEAAEAEDREREKAEARFEKIVSYLKRGYTEEETLKFLQGFGYGAEEIRTTANTWKAFG